MSAVAGAVGVITERARPSVHPKALCESRTVGEGTRIWAFAHVLEGAAFVGDPPVTLIREAASLGANCTILSGVTVGRRAMVGAGSVVTRDVPPNAIVVGNSARIVGYVDTPRTDTTAEDIHAHGGALRPVRVRGVALHRLTRAMDMRGTLVAAEATRELPFVPQRAFMVRDVPSRHVRGEHAHRRCEQFLVCLAGSVAVVVDDGSGRDEVVLNDPAVGLYVPPMVWGTQYRYSADAVLLVLASRPYEAEDYIRDYDEFLALTS